MQTSAPAPSKHQKTDSGLNTWPRTRAFASRTILLDSPSLTPLTSRKRSTFALIGRSGSPTWSAALKPANGRRYQGCSGSASRSVSYTHLRAHETDSYLVCRLLLEKKKNYIL